MSAGPARLVGRERELAAADAAIADVAAGESRVLAVLGETGIGKSALLGALHERAEAAGLLVLDGRAAEHERDVPFGLVIDALDDHVATLHPRRIESVGADLAAVLPSAAACSDATPSAVGAGERYRSHRALRALVEMLGRERPVALLLDDLHWADDASVELVLHLLRRPARAPHLLAFALRPVEPAPRVLHATRAAAGSKLISLSPLPHAASLELIGHIPDAARRERLAREAAGNPLFLQELARVAGDPGDALPPTLLAAVQLEVGALPPAARALLEGAAVAGDPFDPELAAAAAGVEADGSLRRSTASSPPTSSARPATAARSASATRCCAAPSTTPRRPRGGSRPTSGSPRRSPHAARAPPCARSTSSTAPAPATRPPSRCSPRPPAPPPATRRRPPPAGTAPARACSRTPSAAGAPGCSARWRSRSPTPAG